YWNMNYHTEHHMYAAVPCYNLARLHSLIRHDMPSCPNGLFATWKQIAAILKIQTVDPTYQYAPALPTRSDQRTELAPALDLGTEDGSEKTVITALEN
ncbi:MAG: fatty acid desaturase, partial [Opitutaceae bacterium]